MIKQKRILNHFITRRIHQTILASLAGLAMWLSPLAWADTLHVADDAHIDLGNPADNTGNVPNLEVSNIVTRKSGDKQTYVAYDLIPLPDGANLEQAFLRLFVGKVHTEGMIDLHLVTEPWDEDSIDGNNDPAIEPSPFTSFYITFSDEGHFVLIDVTPEVREWLDGTTDNFGFALLATPGPDVEVAFDSKENSQSSHQSELELVLGVAEGGVDSSDIADGSITSDDIENESITSEDIADGSVGTDDIEDGSVGSDDIADGSITSDDIADNSINGDNIIDGSIGADDVDEDLVQLRVNGTCALGSAIRVIDNMGEVTCEDDDDSGDITSVQPSGDDSLTGGADSGDVVLGIAPEGVNSNHIADGTIDAADVDKNSVQLRVGSCPANSAIRTIDNQGGVTCEIDGDSGGDITSVQPFANSGLNGGADSGAVLLGIAPNGINSSMIANGTILVEDVNIAEIQQRVSDFCAAGSTIREIHGNGTVTCEQDYFEADTTLDPDLFWKVGGNAGTNPIPGGTHFLGTTDNTVLALGVNGLQAMRYEYVVGGGGSSMNLLGGYSGNKIVNAIGATVGGGGFTDLPNKVEASWGTISGGVDNGVLDRFGTIGGGQSNTTYGEQSTIGGGFSNMAQGTASTVSGGWMNQSIRAWSFIGGGQSNRICDEEDFPLADFPVSTGQNSVIAGGSVNSSCASSSFIGGGAFNRAEGPASMILGGAWNQALGRYSIAAGHFSTAGQDYSIALGHHAKSLHEGAFVWSDASSISDFNSQRDNQFRIEAHGGARFDLGDDNGTAGNDPHWVDLRAQANNTLGNNPLDFRLIDTSTGAYLSLGGGWVSSSDRDRKADFSDVDVQAVLQQVVSIPIQNWRYKVEDEQTRHIGPMAQDFHAVFGLGANPKGIMTVDADGVALAAIQALYQVTQELERRTVELEAQNSRIESLEAAFEELKSQLAPFASERRLTGLSD